MPLSEAGPYLSVAVLCERVLREHDNVLSLIRLVDRIISHAVGIGAPEQMPPVPIDLFAVVSFKSGTARGSASVTLRTEAPSGLRVGEVAMPMFFEGEDRGAAIIARVAFTADQQGVYWVHVLLDGQFVTKMPLRIVYQRTVPG